MLTDRLEEQLPVDTVEEGAYIEIEHPVAAPAAPASLAHGIDRRFAGPVAVGVGVEHRLQNGLQAPTGHLRATRSATVGIPNGRVPPSAFGISPRRTGGGK